MNAPANPAAFPVFDPGVHGHYGMSLRDWFAGQALSSVIASCAADSLRPHETRERMFAEKAYVIADAMLAERAK